MTPGTRNAHPAGELRRWATALLGLLLLPAAALAEGLLSNPDFEAGVHPWHAVGEATVSVTGANPHGGFLSAWVGERGAEEDGIGRDLLGLVGDGETIEVEAWVRLEGEEAGLVRLSVDQEDERGARTVLLNERIVPAGSWWELLGYFTLGEAGGLRELTLRFDGPPAEVTFLLDDVSVLRVAEWRKTADARIEKIRRGDARVLVTDERGRPLPDHAVRVRQTRHHFAFGSAVNRNLLENPEYADFFFSHFEWGVLENESKWRYNEPEPGEVSYADADAILRMCEERGVRMRGHTLLWDVPSKVPHWARDLPAEELAGAVEERLGSALSHFAGRFRHWDVNNEILPGGFYEERLGPGTYAWMFRRARELEPNALLFLNEHKLLTGELAGNAVELVEELAAAGAPVDAIGAQGHFQGRVDPYLVNERLDRLSAAGLPIWITEYDSGQPDEHARAADLETLYRIAFSHPAVDGIVMWGFWAGSHWRGADAAIVDEDWTLNAAGRRYESLMRRWTTERTGTTDAAGEFRFRGFHGEYMVEVTGADGVVRSAPLELLPGTAVATVTFEVESPPLLPRPWLSRAPLTLGGDAECSGFDEWSAGCAGPRVGPGGEIRAPISPR